MDCMKRKRDDGAGEQKKESKKQRKVSPAMAAMKELQDKLKKKHVIQKDKKKEDAKDRYPDELDETEMEGVLDFLSAAPQHYQIVRVPTETADGRWDN